MTLSRQCLTETKIGTGGGTLLLSHNWYTFSFPLTNVLTDPFLDTSLGVRGQGTIGRHGKHRPFHRRRKRSLFQAILQNRMQPQHLPQGSQKIGPAHRNALEKSQRGISPFRTSLYLDGVLRGEETGETPGESFNRRHIQFIGTAKGMQDIGPGLPGLGIADIMGELDVGHCGSVFVFPGDCSYIHTYSNSMYSYLCQGLNHNSHAYNNFSFPKVGLRNFNCLHRSNGRKMPTTVEPGILTNSNF